MKWSIFQDGETEKSLTAPEKSLKKKPRKGGGKLISSARIRNLRGRGGARAGRGE